MIVGEAKSCFISCELIFKFLELHFILGKVMESENSKVMMENDLKASRNGRVVDVLVEKYLPR